MDVQFMINAILTLTFPDLFCLKLKLNIFLLVFSKRQCKGDRISTQLEKLGKN